MDQNDFLCMHCHKQVTVHPPMGTAHRNHCPFCLWSKHVDENKPGDRLSHCFGGMEPVGLTFKHEGINKYGKQKQGELMVVHICTTCKKININRIAGDDNEKTILTLLSYTPDANTVIKIQNNKIDLLTNKDRQLVSTQLFGLGNAPHEHPI